MADEIYVYKVIIFIVLLKYSIALSHWTDVRITSTKTETTSFEKNREHQRGKQLFEKLENNVNERQDKFTLSEELNSRQTESDQFSDDSFSELTSYQKLPVRLSTSNFKDFQDLNVRRKELPDQADFESSFIKPKSKVRKRSETRPTSRTSNNRDAQKSTYDCVERNAYGIFCNKIKHKPASKISETIQNNKTTEYVNNIFHLKSTNSKNLDDFEDYSNDAVSRSVRDLKTTNMNDFTTVEAKRHQIFANLTHKLIKSVSVVEGSEIEILRVVIQFNWPSNESNHEKSANDTRSSAKNYNNPDTVGCYEMGDPRLQRQLTIFMGSTNKCNYNPSFAKCTNSGNSLEKPKSCLTLADRWTKVKLDVSIVYNTEYFLEVEQTRQSPPSLVSKRLMFHTPACLTPTEPNTHTRCNKTQEALSHLMAKQEEDTVSIICATYLQNRSLVRVELDWTVPEFQPDPARWNSNLLEYRCEGLVCRHQSMKFIKGTKTEIKLPVNESASIWIVARNDTRRIIYKQLLINTFPDRMSVFPSCESLQESGAMSASSTPGSTGQPSYNALLISLLVLVAVGLAGVLIAFELRGKRRRTFFCITKKTSRHQAAEVGKSNSYLPSPSGSGVILRSDLPLLGITPPDEWEIDPREVTLGVEIGQGAFGRVLTGYYQNQQIAIKILKDYIPDSYRDDLMQEIALMKNIGSHPNIVSMIGACTVREPIALLMEYMPYGNLQSFLKKCRTDRELHGGPDKDDIQYCLLDEMTGQKEMWKISANDVLSFARQIAVAMEFLSEKKLVHRDLAARNVLLGSGKVVKVADFGLARMVSALDMNQYCKRTGGRLPLKWMAIESIKDRVFTSQSDVWSFGILLWEMVALGASPYPTIALVDVYRLLTEGYRMQQPNNCSDDLYDIMSQCWSESPNDRPCFSSIRAQLESMLSRNTDYLDLDNIDIPLNHSQPNQDSPCTCHRDGKGCKHARPTKEIDLDTPSPFFDDDDPLQLHLDFC